MERAERGLTVSYKQTNLWNVDNWKEEQPLPPEVKEAGLCIKNGETVAFPTETVYGLGANALSDAAVDKIYQAKGRPGDNPLIVHIGKKEQWNDLCSSIPAMAETLAEAFWPGPLTLVVPRSSTVSDKVTAGLSTVGIRMPDHIVARALINTAGVPVAAPSANRSGRPSPTKAEHVHYDLNGRIAGILQGGEAGYGLESTVVDCTGGQAVILRPGGVTLEQITEVLGDDLVFQKEHSEKREAPKAPGMKYRHYAPSSPLVLMEGDMHGRLIEEKKQGSKVGVMAVEENKPAYQNEADVFISLGSRHDLREIASRLYDSLRTADQSQVDMIFCETFPETEIGAAIMNRLRKAASSS